MTSRQSRTRQASATTAGDGLASASRLSADTMRHDARRAIDVDETRNQRPQTRSSKRKYPISSMLVDPKAPASLLPALPSLAQNPYLPASLASLGTAFTSAGTLPPSATVSQTSSASSANPNGSSTGSSKAVAQRRSQAPPLVMSEVRKVGPAEFDAYLTEVGPAYERWQRESKIGRRGTADLGAVMTHGSPQMDRGSGHATAFEGAESGRTRQNKEEQLPPLDGVPQIFFDPAFNLSNPRTFDLVTERIQDTPHGSPQLNSTRFDDDYAHDIDSQRAAKRNGHAGPAHETTMPGLGPLTLADLATDQILQEKLSHYTAVIESHLVREIGLRSASFFSALSNLQQLHQQGEDTLVQISHLERALARGQGPNDTETHGVGAAARRGLDILRAQARRRGLEKIERAVRTVEEVWSGVEAVRAMVDNGEWVGALEVGEQIEAAYHGSASAASGEESGAPATTSSSTAVVRELEQSGNDIGLPRPSTRTSSLPLSATTRPSSTSSRPLNLTRIKALNGVPRKLAQLRQQVARSLEAELIAVLEHEMDNSMDEYVRCAKRGRTWKGKGKDTGGEEGDLGRSLDQRVRLDVFVRRKKLALEDSGSYRLEGTSSSGEDSREENQEPGEEVQDEASSPSSASSPSEERAAERARERIRPVVSGLVRADGLESAVAAWRELALKQIRALVRTHLPSSNDTPAGEEDDAFAQLAVKSVSRASVDLGSISDKSISLAKKLRGMSHEAFLELAQDTYLGLLACLEVVELHSRVLIELAQNGRSEERQRKAKRRRLASDLSTTQSSSVNGASSLTVPGANADGADLRTKSTEPESPTTADDTTTNDITDVVHAIAELANLRFSKVIGVRTEVHASLELADFLDIFDVSWAFLVHCELVCQRMIVGLRGVMVGQAKTFFQAFHQKRLTESARLVENEQWVAADVPPSTQAIVNLLLQGATTDPTPFLLGTRLRNRVGSKESSVEQSPAEVDGGNAQEADKQVDIDGRKYYAVSAGLAALETLADYVRVVVNCPLLTTDAMSKVVEFMKSYNSRTCQVVLGAGAMRSAGLKNITAKHLALASQALSIMISLIPYIRETIRRHLSTKQAVMLTEFDKLKRDYQEHQNEIHSKLVAIMSDRLQVHARTFETINWEQPSPKEGMANSYIESLVKENITLHKVLSRFLSPDTVDFIMGQVFTATDTRMMEEFGKVEVKSDTAKVRLLIDAAHLKNKLGELKGLSVTAPGQQLEALIEAKPVPVQKSARVSLDKSTPSASPALPQLPLLNASTASLPRASLDTPELSSSPTLPRQSTDSQRSSVATPDRTSTPAPAAVENSSPASTGPPPAEQAVASDTAAISEPPSSAATVSAVVPAPAPTVSLATEAPRKKTLAERLADMAKRSRGGPAAPTTVTATALTATTGVHQLASASSTPATLPNTPVLPSSTDEPSAAAPTEQVQQRDKTPNEEPGVVDDLLSPVKEVVTGQEERSDPVETNGQMDVAETLPEQSTLAVGEQSTAEQAANAPVKEYADAGGKDTAQTAVEAPEPYAEPQVESHSSDQIVDRSEPEDKATMQNGDIANSPDPTVPETAPTEAIESETVAEDGTAPESSADAGAVAHSDGVTEMESKDNVDELAEAEKLLEVDDAIDVAPGAGGGAGDELKVKSVEQDHATAEVEVIAEETDEEESTFL